MSDPWATIETGARLHVGFQNLSAQRDRLFGGIGIAIGEPRVVVSARPATELLVDRDVAVAPARRVLEHLDLPGVEIRVHRTIPRHRGFGSGTQVALAVGAAIGAAYDRAVLPRKLAPVLERGGRSGVGVVTFETGGFVVDAGHPTESVGGESVTGARVPAVAVREAVPEHWRFVLVRPAVTPGRSTADEETSIARTIDSAAPDPAERIEAALHDQVLPGIRSGDIGSFGAGITQIDRLTGEWFQDEQGDPYRSACTAIADVLADADAVAGWGQSSWGPLMYGLTTDRALADATDAGRRALREADVDGTIDVVSPRNRGAVRTTDDEPPERDRHLHRPQQ